MKSYSIKINNDKIIEYLEDEFKNLNLDNIFYCTKKFKNYKNLIIHYKGQYISIFEHNLTDILSNCILSFYENKFIEKIINYNYFYFNDIEKKEIKKNCIRIITNNKSDDINLRKDILWNCIYDYILENKNIVLQGFINFRISNYKKILDNVVDLCVNNFIIDREYHQFVDLLNIYINSKPCQTDTVNLIYIKNSTILLDNNKKIIPYSDTGFNAKYLSDITFSENDNVLNTLLYLIPKEINIHLIAEYDEFIKTLELIFDGKVNICTDCNICKTYKILENAKSEQIGKLTKL